MKLANETVPGVSELSSFLRSPESCQKVRRREQNVSDAGPKQRYQMIECAKKSKKDSEEG